MGTGGRAEGLSAEAAGSRNAFKAQSTSYPTEAVAISQISAVPAKRFLPCGLLKAADDRFEGLVEAAAVGIGGDEALARYRYAVEITVRRRRLSTPRRPPIMTLATAVPSSAWTSWFF